RLGSHTCRVGNGSSPWMVQGAGRRCGARRPADRACPHRLLSRVQGQHLRCCNNSGAQGQNVISTGPYAVIRCPMYAWSLPMVLGTALALGSWWRTLMVLPMIAALVARILNEERYLAINLAGYQTTSARSATG